jgi:hydrogenase maturation protease
MTDTSTLPLAIITLGNELMGDDGVGPAVYEALSTHSLPDHITLIDGGTGGFSVLHMIGDYETVIIVDCGDFGGNPGDIALFSPHDVISMKTVTYSLHDVDLLKVMDIAQSIDEAPSTVHIVAIQPRKITFDSPLSSEVAAAIPDTVTLIQSLIEKITADIIS